MPNILMQNNANAVQKPNLCGWAADSKSGVHSEEREVEREGRWGHGGLLLGGVTTKPAGTGDRPYQMPHLCPSRPPPPRTPTPPPPLGAGAGTPSETWGQDSFFSSHALSEAEHLVPKEGGGSSRGGGGGPGMIGWATPPQDLSLFYLAHISFHFRPSLPPPSHSLVVLLSGSQLSDWEMAGETEVFCLGRWSREDWGLRTQTHKWSVFPSAPVKLGTCCNT